MKIKIYPLDRSFSKYIKLRDKYCQRCGGTGGLQTSHFWGRAKKVTRWDEENAVLLCFGCHQYFHSRPLEHSRWFEEHLGQPAFDLLEARAHIPTKVDEKLIEIYLLNRIKEVENE